MSFVVNNYELVYMLVLDALLVIGASTLIFVLVFYLMIVKVITIRRDSWSSSLFCMLKDNKIINGTTTDNNGSVIWNTLTKGESLCSEWVVYC